MKVGLAEVARRAGVSAKTASGALHGGPARLSEATRARVRAAAAELGYRPNLAARGMRTGILPVVGVVADGLITTPFAAELVRALDNALSLAETSLVVASLGPRRDAAAALRGLAGLMPRAVAYAALHHKLVDPPGPVRLLVNCRDPAGRLPALVPAERAAAAEITARLIAGGRRRIAFLTLPGLVAGELRARGWRDAHDAAGLPADPALLQPATAGALYGERARSRVAPALAALFATPRPPDAVLCGADRIALEAYNALQRLGRRIPDDVAVASFDDQVEIAARLDPPLTTMALPYRAMGREAARLLLSDAPPEPGLRELPFRLVARESA